MDKIFKTIGSSCCPPQKGAVKGPGFDQDFVAGSVDTPAGKAPGVSSRLVLRDRWGTFKARWGIGRMDYAVDPGLYALGKPDSRSPVLVSANYKMSFDRLRQALPGRDAWLLVLDTDGINVWCAAGKGTFGTDELVRRIGATGLKDVVSHRDLVVPQLAGPGVAAHLVKKRSGFSIHWGPIKAKDIPAYLDAGCKADNKMRRKSFTLTERLVLVPVELVHALKPGLIAAPVLFLLGGLGGPGAFWANAFNYGLFAVLAFFSALLGGTLLNAALLPYLPGRAFSTKGLVIGFAVAGSILFARGNFYSGPGAVEAVSWLLIVAAVTAYLAMNFTGCSTYTSLSGVKKEMRWALPLEIGMAACGLLGWITSRFIS